MDLNVKGSSLADIVSCVESQSPSTDQSCQVDFPLFLTIYSVHTGLVSSPTPPRELPIMWIPTSSGMWLKVCLYCTLLAHLSKLERAKVLALRTACRVASSDTSGSEEDSLFIAIDDLPKVLGLLGVEFVTPATIKDASLVMRCFLPGLQSGYLTTEVNDAQS
jgi:hypothetical protein